MHILFDDAGKLLTGRLMSEAESSLQVELDSGKRVKVKSANALLRFEKPAPAELMPAATALADIEYTLQTGREHMPYRWATVVRDREALLSALQDAVCTLGDSAEATPEGRLVFTGEDADRSRADFFTERRPIQSRGVIMTNLHFFKNYHL